jgi:hypothetical protein
MNRRSQWTRVRPRAPQRSLAVSARVVLCVCILRTRREEKVDAPVVLAKSHDWTKSVEPGTVPASSDLPRSNAVSCWRKGNAFGAGRALEEGHMIN